MMQIVAESFCSWRQEVKFFRQRIIIVGNSTTNRLVFQRLGGGRELQIRVIHLLESFLKKKLLELPREPALPSATGEEKASFRNRTR